MLPRFIDNVKQQHLFPSGQQVLLAISGGIDSVVLSHLMHAAGFPFAVAHCNFHLRPGDCDRDEAFVRQLASSYGVPCHVVQFDTGDYARKYHLCIEDAARRQRYDFFEQLRVGHGYAAILTAHHRDDSVETFFLNLMRGTGLSGLHGILPVHGHVVRPLLPFSREEIERYADEHGLQHVEDVTNASLEYRRNQVRHRLMPLLREMYPGADNAVSLTIHNLQSVECLYQTMLRPLREQLVSESADGVVTVSLADMSEYPLRQLLYELLEPYGFNAFVVDDILAASQSGKCFFSATHKAVLDRGRLMVQPLEGAAAEDNPPEMRVAFSPMMCKVSEFSFPSPSNEACFDADKVVLPLALRHWQQGDRFHPLGVKGSQLVSDYFSDHKFSLMDKQRQWLLTDATGEILWIVGQRTSQLHRLTDDTKIVLKILIEK